jgi:hypothetical protein
MLRRAAAVIAINLVVMIAAFGLDRAMAPLSLAWQFTVQVPVLVLLVDEFRRWCLRTLGLTESEVNGAFFFAAPLAALASDSLMTAIRETLLGH